MQCETMKPAPFACGGTRHQCQNDATHICTGKTAAEKKMAPMGLCDDCVKEFLRRNPDYKACIKKIETGRDGTRLDRTGYNRIRRDRTR